MYVRTYGGQETSKILTDEISKKNVENCKLGLIVRDLHG